jgi:hypothetical protein
MGIVGVASDVSSLAGVVFYIRISPTEKNICNIVVGFAKLAQGLLSYFPGSIYDMPTPSPLPLNNPRLYARSTLEGGLVE